VSSNPAATVSATDVFMIAVFYAVDKFSCGILQELTTRESRSRKIKTILLLIRMIAPPSGDE
jgi:hypothetical protein